MTLNKLQLDQRSSFSVLSFRLGAVYLNGAATRVTVAEFLAVSFFKETVVDCTLRGRWTRHYRSLCGRSLPLDLFLSSDRTARRLLSGNFNQKLVPGSSPLPGYSIADIYRFYHTQTQRHKRFSIESDTILIADDDFIAEVDNVSVTNARCEAL